MIPALQEQHERFLKLLQIAKSFGYSDERLGKKIDTSWKTLLNIRAGDWQKHAKYMPKYLELNDRLKEFVVQHIEGNIDHFKNEIEEREVAILEIKNI